MFEFGKKISFRALLVSLAVALIPGIAAQQIFDSITWGLGIGFIFFLLVFLGHYFNAVPVEFQYWKVDQNTIKYTDLSNWQNRILGMLMPPAIHFTTINKADIKEISLVGDINKNFKAQMAIPYTAAIGVFYAGIAMVHNPDYIRVQLKDGTTIDLSIRRDYTYDRTKTIQKLNQFFVSLDDSGIKIDLP